MDTCRILMAQPLSKEDISYFENEAKKGGLIIQETKKVESLRELYRKLKEIENGAYKYNAVILQQCMGKNSENVSANELDKIKKSAPGIKILLCISDDTYGASYLKEVFDAGVYTAFFAKDGTPKNLVELLKNGRTAQAAISYYGIPHDEKTLQRAIGYMDKSRLTRQINLIHTAENDEDISRVLQHLRKMLTPKELLFVIKHLDEEDLKKVFFQRGMSIFFDKARYNSDSEEHSGFFSKLLKQDNLSLSDYIIDHGTLEARMDLIKLQNEQKREAFNTTTASEIKKEQKTFTQIQEEECEKIETEEAVAEKKAEEIVNTDTNTSEKEDIFNILTEVPKNEMGEKDSAENTLEEVTQNPQERTFSTEDPLEILKLILERDVSLSVLEQMAQMIKEEKLKKYTVNISPIHIKSEEKKAKRYCIAAASKSAGTTFIASVLAHTYKEVNPDHRVCVFSFQDTLAKFADLIGLGTDSLPDSNKISLQNVDYIIGRRNEVDERLAFEYDAIFIDFKNVQSIGKDSKNTIFLVTQGKRANVSELQKAASFVKEHSILDVTLLINLTAFKPEDDIEVGRMLAWKDCFNIPYLKSATRGLKMCKEFFENEKKGE